ncbi:ECF transporter S component [Candidatus Enterococcus murrayae]|uniref:ECF transporter S component n=1 Tax=Candidatus Enterococcus murrayae TaxID=2815321 RepID=A0ABS3HLS1_9ENTE|nr:ECF transporter S component [Enterococcus sp. MJM16]MBO0454407.1 ECF transporter S component [Enterococcus sp. MJM16]
MGIVWCSSLNNSNSKVYSFFALGVKELSLLSMMIALCVVSRSFFQFIVNVQPVTAILLIITIYWGVYQGLIVSVLSILITNFYMGMGIWTVAQIVTYFLIIFLTGLLKKLPAFKNSILVQAIYAGITGLLFGLFISAIQAPFFGISAFLPYYLAGVPTDVMHAVGNVAFYLLLTPILRKLLTQTIQRWRRASSK